MMKIEKVVQNATAAIRANFASRNACFLVGCPRRHARMVAQRRQQIREWIAVLRIARKPGNAATVEQATNAGPLMAHDLRRRIICAGQL